MVDGPIVFLHIPKTAGQSVRSYLSRAFPKRRIFPGQLDEHLCQYSRDELRSYGIFCGHFSWAMLDALGPDTRYLTVLREPTDRILSLYKYLRSAAQALNDEQLKKPENRALFYARECKFDDYLDIGDEQVGEYVRNHFDNYYSYYFGTRLINGRSILLSQFPQSDYFNTERIVHNALLNLTSSVSVFRMSNLEAMRTYISSFSGYSDTEMPRVNVRSNFSEMSREEDLRAICRDYSRGAELLHLFCQFDARIFAAFD